MNLSDPSAALFKNVFGLGPQVRLHARKAAARWRGIVLGLFFSGGGVLAVLAAGGYVLYQVNRYGPAIRDRTIQQTLVPAAVIGGIMVIIGLLVLWNTYRNWNLAAAVYQDGFAVSNHAGVQSYRWTDVASLTSAITRRYTNGVYTGTTHIYTLVDRQGRKTVLNDSMPDVEALAESIEKGIFPHLYQAAADAYNYGKPVAFGPVVISKQGAQIGKKMYAWKDIGRVTLDKGYLKIARKDGGWFSGASAPAAAIPNLPVLLSILQQVHR